MTDQRFFGADRRPLIHVNWQSFLNEGFPADWQWPVLDAIINSYTRWMHIAGIDLRPVFWNFTTETSFTGDNLVVMANEHHFGRLASWFGNSIVFHRRNGQNGTPWNWVPRHASPGEFDMYTVFHHELGHALGLDHESDDPTFMKWYWDFGRYGPFNADITSVRGLYSNFARNNLRQLRSVDGGQTWTSVTNQLTTYGHSDARTNLGPAVTVTDTGDYIVAWTLIGGSSTWLRGNGQTFRFNEWFFYGGERSPYGMALGSDGTGTMLWAWTDEYKGTWPDTSQWHRVRVVRSTDRGAGWAWGNTPAEGASIGAPGLACTRVAGQAVWILVWTLLDPADQNRCGSVMVSSSMNAGWTWTTPVELSRGRALSGASVAADGQGRFIVAYADAPRATNNGINQIRWHDCRVVAGQVVDQAAQQLGYTTRIQPALTFDTARQRFIMAWRGQDRNTTLNVLTMGASETAFGGYVWLGMRSHVAPALASSPARGEAVLWYASDD